MLKEIVELPDRMCDPLVEVPTIVVEPLHKDGKPEVFVQWFGEANGVEIPGVQFRFPVPIGPDDKRWMHKPQSFNVVMLSKAVNWPSEREKERRGMIQFVDGDPNAILLWLTSSLYGIMGSPANIVIAMTTWLTYSAHGVITPKHYLDYDVFNRETEKYYDSFR